MKINPNSVQNVKLHGVAELLKPVVFKDGNVYCCALGLNPIVGVFGCGDSPMEAIEDWEDTLKIRLQEADSNDEIVLYVKQILADLPKPKHVQAFYDQFIPR